MDYQVSARKYRPGTFDDVVGQSHVVQTLMNAVDTKRIAHAYLFSGPRGVGKTTTIAKLAANAAAHGHDRGAGPPREGAALLQGIIVCGRCGNRMTIRYHTRGGNQLVDSFLLTAVYLQPGETFAQRYLVFRDVTLAAGSEAEKMKDRAVCLIQLITSFSPTT